MEKYQIKDQESLEKISAQFNKKKSKLNIEEKVDKAVILLTKENKAQEAYKILKKLIEDFEAGIQIENNENFAVYSFDSQIEFIMKTLENRSNNIKQGITWLMDGERSYFNIYYYFAYTLIELQRLDEAQEALNKALMWNPVSAGCYLEYADIALRKNDIDKADELLHKALNYTFNAKQLALCYRKLGYCYTERKEYEIALHLYAHSRIFDNDSSVAAKEMEYIFATADRKIDSPKSDYKEEVLLKNNIPYEASDLVKAAIYKLVKFYEEEKEDKDKDYLIKMLRSIVLE